MFYYFIDKNIQISGKHEVHKNDCEFLPDTSSREYLGYFIDCQEAINIAYEKYDNVEACKNCIPECRSKKISE